MHINHWLRIILCSTVLLVSLQLPAQTKLCKDTAEHRRLHDAMWSACSQNDPKVLYQACLVFQRHADAEKDKEGYYNAWVCGIMYNLDRMNIHDAYHITHTLKEDLAYRKEDVEERYLVPKMLGHVYNTCGNIPGAMEEFQKAAKLIKGTRYEADGLSFLYLGLAHIQLNNNIKESLYWIEKDLEELNRHQDQANYYRGLADAYAVRAILRFKQHQYNAFRHDYELAEKADSDNPEPIGDLFLPYARIYKTLLDGKADEAKAAVSTLASKKEQYLLLCDIYHYLGDNENAFLTQRDLMHKRDSITGVMIAENLQKQEEEMTMMKKQQEMARLMNYILLGGVVLAILVIVLLHRNLLIRRKFSKRLMAKNEELRVAYKKVAAADQMKTEFIRNVSHEIRTPLNIINGFTQVLTDEDNTFEPQERHDIAVTISQNTRQITSLVNKMLALANESTKDLQNEVEETDALDICQRAIMTMPDIDKTRIKVEMIDQTGDADKKLTTNSDSLLQMLSNILENAAKFTEDGYIRLTLRKDKTHFHFTVEDTGCGIPADKVDTIFERFMKVDEFKEGLGLGLAYCHETVEKLGGTLTLDQTSEAGTTFTLSLPIKLKTK